MRIARVSGPLLGLSLSAAAGTPTILLTAVPRVIEADGRSASAISAEVRDSFGKVLQRPANVRFTTSLGTIDAVVPASGGLARATLRSGTLPGMAVVTALLEGEPAVARIQVEFVSPGTAISRESFYTVAAENYLAYGVQQKIVDALGGVRITCRGLTITADEAQVDVGTNTVHALQRGMQSEIRLSRRGTSLACSALNFDLSRMRGAATIQGENGPRQVSVSGWELRTSEPDARLPDSSFEPVALSSAGVVVKARGIAVRMGQEIQFKRAKVYVDGEQALSIPLYTIALDGAETGFGRYVSYGSSGVALDFPLYYRLEPQNSGALRIRHNQQGGWGWYSVQPGWSLDLEQQYLTGKGDSGKFAISRLTRGDWGGHWMQESAFSPTSRGYFCVDSPNHEDLFARATLSHSFASSSATLDLSGNERGGDFGGRADLYVRTNARPLGIPGLRYSISSRSSYAMGTGGSAGQGVQLQMYSSPYRVGGSGLLSGSLSLGHDWGGSRRGASVLGYLALTRTFSNSAGGTFSYAYTSQPGLHNAARHTLTGSLYAGGGVKWQASLYATAGLDYRSVSSFADFAYALSPKWRFALSATHSSFAVGKSGGSAGYTDLEFAISRSLGEALGNQELAAVWSTSYKNIRLEIRAARL